MTAAGGAKKRYLVGQTMMTGEYYGDQTDRGGYGWNAA